MGIFKKLFGDSTDKSSNDINSTVKGSYEQQTTNSIRADALNILFVNICVILL